jgi:predicted DNA-binding protein
MKGERIMNERPKKQYSVQLESEVIDKIDYYANEYNLTRSQLMRNLIVTGLDDMGILQKAGILKAAQFTDKVVTAIKDLIRGEKIYMGENGKLKIKE